MRTLLAASVVLLALLPATALAQGGETESGGQEYRIPMQVQSIYAIVPLKPGDRALELYRSLVPRGYGMPAEPQVGVYLGEPNIPRKIPGQPYNEYSRWVEGPLAIKVRFGGEEGYFPIAMPVSSKFEYDLGRAAGLPKILVSGVLEESEGGFTIKTSVGDRNAITLRWRRGPVEVSEETQRFAHLRYKLFALLPALVGPDLYFTQFTPEPTTPTEGTAPVPPPFVPPEPEPGTVEYVIAADLDALVDTLPDLFALRDASLADLIEPRGTVPGLYWDLPQTLRLRSGDIGDGGGYDGAPPATPGNAASAATAVDRRCQSRRVVRITPPLRRGERVRRARVSLDGKPFRVVRGKRRRVPVDLTGLPRGRFSVKVVALTTRERTVRTTRRYRTCAPRR